jgi:hypothetical protein
LVEVRISWVRKRCHTGTTVGEETSSGETKGRGVNRAFAEDRRRQLLIYMTPEAIKDLKRAALDEGRPAYVLGEGAIVDFLKRRKRKK